MVEPGPPDVLTALPSRIDRANASTRVAPISIGGTGSSSGDGHLEVVARPSWNPRARIRRQASQEFQDQVGISLYCRQQSACWHHLQLEGCPRSSSVYLPVRLTLTRVLARWLRTGAPGPGTGKLLRGRGSQGHRARRGFGCPHPQAEQHELSGDPQQCRPILHRWDYLVLYGHKIMLGKRRGLDAPHIRSTRDGRPDLLGRNSSRHRPGWCPSPCPPPHTHTQPPTACSTVTGTKPTLTENLT